METLLIRFSVDDSVNWAVLDTNGEPQDDGTGELENAAAQAPHRRVVVLVPTDNILLTTVRTRARKAQQLAKVVPYALEDELADDIENLHFAIGRQTADGEYPVAVVAHDQMQDWMAQLEGVSLSPRAIIPDVLALPQSDGIWSVLLEDERAIVRTDAYSGFVMEPDNLQRLLAGLAETPENLPEEMAIYRCETARRHGKLALPVQYSEYDRCPPALLAENLRLDRAVNLLQGVYRSQDNVGGLIKPWRAAAILAGVWVLISVGIGYYQNSQLGREHAALKAQIESTYRQAFPDAKRIVNPRAQMQQRLAQLQHSQSDGVSNEFMMMLKTSGTEVNDARQVKIETMNYRKGRLIFELAASDLQSLDRIKQAIQKDGLSADIESAESRDDNVHARLNIQQ